MSVVHRFPDLEKKKLRNVDCCSGLLATFSKKKKKQRREGTDEIEVEEEDDETTTTRALPCFSDVGAPPFENKHRKDRNCFSERFDSGQMNLLKYTRNSTSRQYLHGRGGRIYIRASCCIAPFKPAKRLDDAAIRGHVDAVFIVAEQLDPDRGEKIMQAREAFFAMFRSGTRSVGMVPSAKSTWRKNCKNKIGNRLLLFR